MSDFSDFYYSRNNALVLLKTRRRGSGTAVSDSTRALLQANGAGVCSPCAAFAFAAERLPAQLASQGRQDPQASGSALSLHLPPQQLPLPLPSLPSHLSLIHHITTPSLEVKPSKEGWWFLISEGRLDLSFRPKNTKQKKPLPSLFWRQHLAQFTTFTAFPDV